jgi:uncharacterized protein YigA (DUF484 family)
MNISPKNWHFDDKLSEEAVVHYLQQHPEFFTHHENLLATMKIPHISGAAISLVERQLAVLREENQQLQRQLDKLVKIAQENEQLNGRIQHLVAALASATGIEEFFHILYTTLENEFNTHAVAVRWFELPSGNLAQRPEFMEYDAQVFALFENLLTPNPTPVCGQLTSERLEYLFPNNNIASAILLPLGKPEPQGILAMGSHDISRFHASMGTELLQYMADLISYLLKMWLQLTATL